MAFHGYPRATKDLDLWIDSSPENAARVLAAILAFFGETLGLVENDFLAPGVVPLGYAPNRIDLVSPPHLYRGLRPSPGNPGQGHPRPGDRIGLEDLLALKRAFGRAQDRADVEALEEEEE